MRFGMTDILLVVIMGVVIGVGMLDFFLTVFCGLYAQKCNRCYIKNSVDSDGRRVSLEV